MPFNSFHSEFLTRLSLKGDTAKQTAKPNLLALCHGVIEICDGDVMCMVLRSHVGCDVCSRAMRSKIAFCLSKHVVYGNASPENSVGEETMLKCDSDDDAAAAAGCTDSTQKKDLHLVRLMFLD